MFFLNSHRKKNFTIVITSILFSILFFYLLYFVKTYFTNHEKAPFLFDELFSLFGKKREERHALNWLNDNQADLK